MNSKLPVSRIPAQIIALDLDDTLLKNDVTISDYTVSVMQKAVQKNIYVTLCSGRSDNAMLPYVRQMDIAGNAFGRYMITQNGTSVADLHLRQSVYSRLVDSDVLIHVYRAAKEYNLTTHVYDSGTIYASDNSEWGDIDVKLSGLQKVIVDDYENFLHTGHQKIVVPGTPEVLTKLQSELKKDIGNKCVIFTSKPYFLEILPKNSGKGEALLWLADKLNIPTEHTVAFGDGMNDESMIRLAGIGVAMKNGLPYIQEIAAYITEFTNEEDGVARFVEKFML
ncbi:MAG: Cof-type HAD-IIB family hydrolase [Spirochaetales bacterium]